MTEKKEQVIQRLKEPRIISFEIKESEVGKREGLEPAGANDYLISLLNDTDQAMDVVGTTPPNQPQNRIKWFSINPVGRTCHQDVQTCYNNGNYSVIFAVPCADPAFDMWIGWRTGPTTVRAYGPWTVYPNCQLAGGVFPIE